MVNSYAADGTSLGSSPRPLVPGQKFIGVSTDLNLPAGTAWFSLQSQIPLVGFELFGRANFNSLAGYSVVDLERKSGVFPKVEKNGGWTGIAFVNTENQQATVTLKAYNDTGNIIASGTKTLTAHQKWVGYPVDANAASSLFLPGTSLSAATYLAFSADRNVAGFQLNSAGAMLDALQPSVPSGQKVIDQVLGLLQYQSSVTSGTTALTDILNQILGTSSGGTCPQVTIVPPLDNLTTLPSAITLTASFGNGCKPSGSTDTLSGQVVLAITNLNVSNDLSNISLNYALTATNLKRNGDEVILNGAVSGNIAFAGSQLTASVNFNNFQAAGSAFSGGMSIAATNLSLGDTINFGTTTITFNNLTVAGYTVTSGTLTLTSPSSGTTQMVATLNTNEGAVNLTLRVQTVQTPTGSTRTIISTTTPGTIGGYTVTVNNVTIDSACANNPLAGSVTVSQGGSTVTRTFSATCTPADSVTVQQDGSSVPRTFTSTRTDLPTAASLTTGFQEIKGHITRILTPSVQ
jgi:hypothetical protein